MAVVAALVVAEAAVLLLRPRDGVIDPAPVSAASYFSAAEIDRARDFRGPQLALYGATLGVEVGVLGLLVARPPRRCAADRRPGAGGRGGRRRPVGPARRRAAAAAAVAHQRAVDVGLSTQGWADWGGDLASAWAIGGVWPARAPRRPSRSCGASRAAGGCPARR